MCTTLTQRAAAQIRIKVAKECTYCKHEQKITLASNSRSCCHVAFIFHPVTGVLSGVPSVYPANPSRPDWASGWEKDEPKEDVPGIVEKLTAAGYQNILLREMTVAVETGAGLKEVLVTAGYVKAIESVQR